jgi:hypothetical protein
MPTLSESVRVRLPQGLIGRLRDEAEQQGVSMNTLLATLIAGAVGWTLNDSKEEAMSTQLSNFGYLRTVKGRDEDGRSSRVIDRADGSVHGHVWLPSGQCAAFKIKDDRAIVGMAPLRKDAWEEVLRKERGD